MQENVGNNNLDFLESLDTIESNILKNLEDINQISSQLLEPNEAPSANEGNFANENDQRMRMTDNKIYVEKSSTVIQLVDNVDQIGNSANNEPNSPSVSDSESGEELHNVFMDAVDDSSALINKNEHEKIDLYPPRKPVAKNDQNMPPTEEIDEASKSSPESKLSVTSSIANVFLELMNETKHETNSIEQGVLHKVDDKMSKPLLNNELVQGSTISIGKSGKSEETIEKTEQNIENDGILATSATATVAEMITKENAGKQTSVIIVDNLNESKETNNEDLEQNNANTTDEVNFPRPTITAVSSEIGINLNSDGTNSFTVVNPGEEKLVTNANPDLELLSKTNEGIIETDLSLQKCKSTNAAIQSEQPIDHLSTSSDERIDKSNPRLELNRNISSTNSMAITSVGDAVNKEMTETTTKPIKNNRVLALPTENNAILKESVPDFQTPPQISEQSSILDEKEVSDLPLSEAPLKDDLADEKKEHIENMTATTQIITVCKPPIGVTSENKENVLTRKQKKSKRRSRKRAEKRALQKESSNTESSSEINEETDNKNDQVSFKKDKTKTLQEYEVLGPSKSHVASKLVRTKRVKKADSQKYASKYKQKPTDETERLINLEEVSVKDDQTVSEDKNSDIISNSECAKVHTASEKNQADSELEATEVIEVQSETKNDLPCTENKTVQLTEQIAIVEPPKVSMTIQIAQNKQTTISAPKRPSRIPLPRRTSGSKSDSKSPTSPTTSKIPVRTSSGKKNVKSFESEKSAEKNDEIQQAPVFLEQKTSTEDTKIPKELSTFEEQNGGVLKDIDTRSNSQSVEKEVVFDDSSLTSNVDEETEARDMVPDSPKSVGKASPYKKSLTSLKKSSFESSTSSKQLSYTKSLDLDDSESSVSDSNVEELLDPSTDEDNYEDFEEEYEEIPESDTENYEEFERRKLRMSEELNLNLNQISDRMNTLTNNLKTNRYSIDETCESEEYLSENDNKANQNENLRNNQEAVDYDGNQYIEDFTEEKKEEPRTDVKNDIKETTELDAMEVRLKQIYFIPSSIWRLVN